MATPSDERRRMSCPPTMTGSSSVCWSLRISGPTACSSLTVTTTTKLAPADPADGVLGPQHRGEAARRLAEHGVAGGVPEVEIDLAEVVQVDVADDHLAAVTAPCAPTPGSGGRAEAVGWPGPCADRPWKAARAGRTCPCSAGVRAAGRPGRTELLQHGLDAAGGCRTAATPALESTARVRIRCREVGRPRSFPPSLLLALFTSVPLRYRPLTHNGSPPDVNRAVSHDDARPVHALPRKARRSGETTVYRSRPEVAVPTHDVGMPSRSRDQGQSPNPATMPRRAPQALSADRLHLHATPLRLHLRCGDTPLERAACAPEWSERPQ